MKSNYNKSCFNISNNKVKENISKIFHSEGYGDDDDITCVTKNLFEYMINKQLFGACHALSAVLYISFSELGYDPKLCIGEVRKNGLSPFDHSWVTLNEKIFDLAIYMPLTRIINSFGGPVIFNVDAVNMKEYNLEYGINTGLPFSTQTDIVLQSSFIDYMSSYPFENDGLWTVLKKIQPNKMKLSIEKLKKNMLTRKERLFGDE